MARTAQRTIGPRTNGGPIPPTIRHRRTGRIGDPVRQSTPMDPRSGGRPPQVRPRPASTGRARPLKTRPVTPSPTRLARYRRIERRRSLPLPLKAAFALAVVLLGAGVLSVASGAVGPLASGLVSGFGGIIDSVGNAVSSPEPTAAPSISDAPAIVPPDEAYTNEDAVDITVTVPASIVGAEGYAVRLWVTLKDQDAKLVSEGPVGPTSLQVMPGIDLEKGRNEFQASIMGPGGESELSEPVAWVLDQSRPKVKIIAPAKASSATSKSSVTVKGKTQARSTVRLKNDLSGAVVTVEAGKDGLFQAKVALDTGINRITITSTDPAGNPNTETITVRRGSGSMLVSLTGSAYRFNSKRLPQRVTFQVVVTDPGGRRLSGASALFTVTVPGLEAIVSSELLTNSNGVASFTTRIPKGALPGSGLATVLVTSVEYGEKSDRQVLTVR